MGRTIQDILYWLDDNLKKRFEYSGSNVIYVGKAKPGKTTSEAFWQIIKLTYSGSDVTQIDFASGTDNFDKVWDDRASYSYS